MIDEHREFVAAETRHRIAGARALHQAVREAAQQLVAGAVPQAVVHGLEVVEVDEQHRRRHAVGDVPDRLVHAVGEQRAIGEQRQRIVERQRAQLVVEPRGIRHVADVERDAANRIHVAQVRDDHLERTLLAVRACGIENAATCSECAARSTWSKTSRTCGALRPEHVVETLAGELAGRHAQQLLGRRAGVADHALGVADGDHVARAAHQLGQALVEAPRGHFAMQAHHLARGERLARDHQHASRPPCTAISSGDWKLVELQPIVEQRDDADR